MKRQEVKQLQYWVDLMIKEDTDKFQPLYAEYIRKSRSLTPEDREALLQHGIEMVVLAKLLNDEIRTVQWNRPLWKKIFNL